MAGAGGGTGVVRMAYNYSKTAVKKDGVTIKPKGYYINVKIIDRFPVDSPTTYRLLPREPVWTIDAEAVILRNVEVAEVVGVAQRRTRSSLQKSKAEYTRTFNLSEQELGRCTEAAEETLDANGGHKHQDKAPAEQLLARNRNG